MRVQEALRRRPLKILTQNSFPFTRQCSLLDSSESTGSYCHDRSMLSLLSHYPPPPFTQPTLAPCSPSSAGRPCLQASASAPASPGVLLPKFPPCLLQILAFSERPSPPIPSKISPLPTLPHPRSLSPLHLSSSEELGNDLLDSAQSLSSRL